METSDYLPCDLTNKDGRTTKIGFAFFGAHQCGILMVDTRGLAACKFIPSETPVLVIVKMLDAQQNRWLTSSEG